MKKHTALLRIICAVLAIVLVFGNAAPAAFAANTQQEEESWPKQGTLEENGLTLIEYTADSFLHENTNNISYLKDMENWPSEKMLDAASETHLKASINLDKAAHLPTNPSLWMDSDKKKKDCYRDILLCLFLEDEETYDDSDYAAFTKYLNSDSKTYKDISNWIDYNKQTSDLDPQEKKVLNNALQDYLKEDAGIGWPVADVITKIISAADNVEDAVELCVEYKALCKKGESYKMIVDTMKKQTNDLHLFAALDEVSNVMKSIPSAFAQTIADGVIDIGLWGAKKAVSEVYNQAVLSALPVELRLALQMGTLAGDAVTSLLFANDDMEASLQKLECIGELGRTMLKTTDKLGEQYKKDRNNRTGVKDPDRRNEAAAYVRSVRAFCDLYKLSCDYSKEFVVNSMDATGFEKLLLIFNKKKNKDYKEAIRSLIANKQNGLRLEQQLRVNSLYRLKERYPDTYEKDLIGGMHAEAYIDKLVDDYNEEMKKVPDDYYTGSLKNTAKKSSGSSEKKTDPEKLIRDFIYNDGPAYDSRGKAFRLKDVQDETKGPVYKVGPTIDIDNDGENELLLTDGFYGGMYLDAKDGKLSVFVEGQGTAGVLGYGYYKGKWVVCHKDTGHTGRNVYSFDVYNGADKITESFTLSAEYWTSADQNGYDDSSTFTFKGKTITRKEYEDLLREIFAKGDPSYASIRMLPKVSRKADDVPDSPYTSFADVVRQYEKDYGKLSFKSSGSGSRNKYYTGVFLLRLLDFDRDGDWELIIGYAAELAEAQTSSPKLDVWQMKNGRAVQIYKGAYIQHGDIGSRCEFLDLAERPALVTGTDASDISLSFLTLEKGSFRTEATLQYEFTGTDYQWSVDGSPVSEKEGMGYYDSIRRNKNKYFGSLSKDLGQTEKSMQDDLKAAYKRLGM